MREGVGAVVVVGGGGGDDFEVVAAEDALDKKRKEVGQSYFAVLFVAPLAREDGCRLKFLRGKW